MTPEETRSAVKKMVERAKARQLLVSGSLVPFDFEKAMREAMAKQPYRRPTGIRLFPCSGWRA